MATKTILITGASRGLGRQLALQYAAPTIHLILIAQNSEKLLEVATACQARGATAQYQSIDVRDSAAIEQFILEIDEKTPIDLVIANAGIISTLQPHWQPESPETIKNVFDINLQGTLALITPLINHMILRKRGQIALISSLAALHGLPQSPSYCASKAAVYIYGQSLRAWLQRYHIQVSVVCPGYIKTDMMDHVQGAKPFLISDEKAARIIQKGLLKNKACIAFPWQMVILTKLANLLPEKLVNKTLKYFSFRAA